MLNYSNLDYNTSLYNTYFLQLPRESVENMVTNAVCRSRAKKRVKPRDSVIIEQEICLLHGKQETHSKPTSFIAQVAKFRSGKE